MFPSLYAIKMSSWLKKRHQVATRLVYGNTLTIFTKNHITAACLHYRVTRSSVFCSSKPCFTLEPSFLYVCVTSVSLPLVLFQLMIYKYTYDYHEEVGLKRSWPLELVVGAVDIMVALHVVLLRLEPSTVNLTFDVECLVWHLVLGLTYITVASDSQLQQRPNTSNPTQCNRTRRNFVMWSRAEC